MATRKGDALAGIGLLGCCRVHSGVVMDVDSVGDGFAKARADIDDPLSPIGAQAPMGLSVGGRPGATGAGFSPASAGEHRDFGLAAAWANMLAPG